MPRPKLAAVPAAAMTEIGRTGIAAWGGQIDAEFLRELKGARGRAVYREMSENDPIVGACLVTITQHLRDVSITVEPSGETHQHAQAAQLVQDCLSGMASTWADVLTEICSMFVYGWCVLELVYRRYDAGRIGWATLAPRAQDSLAEWVLDETGHPTAFVQAPAPTYTRYTIPMEKLLHFRAANYHDSPEGMSLLRRAYVPWYFCKRIRTIEGIGVERDLAGLPVVRIPASVIQAGGATLTAYKNLVTNVRRDEQEGVVLPSDRDAHGQPLYELQLLSTGGRRNFDTGAVIQRYQKDIATALLCDFILLGHEKVGSFALADVKTGSFAIALGGWIDAILEVFNRQGIPRLMALNGWPADVAPSLVRGPIGRVDLAALGQYLTALVGAGFDLLSVPELQEHLMRIADLPVPDNTMGGEDGSPPAAENMPERTTEAEPETED